MSFEPFSVQCPTCGSMLRVSDPSLVGTIAACPRCQSMVQIDRPAAVGGAQVAVGASDVDSQAITEEAIASHVGESDSPESTETSRGFEGGDESAAAEQSDEAALPPPDGWQSDRTRRSRQVAMVIAVSVTGLLAAVLLFVWFVRQWSETDQVAQAGAAMETAPSEPAANDVPAAEPSLEPGAEGDVGGPDTGDAETSVVPGEPSPETTQGDATQQATGVSAEGPDVKSSQESDPNDAPPTTVPGSLRPTSPLDEPAAAPDPAGEDPAAADDAAATFLELPPGLARFTEILPNDGPIDLQPTLQAPPTLDEIEINAAATEDVDPTQRPAREVNVTADLALKLAVDARPYRLGDLTLLYSQLTGVPIDFDWVSFDLIGVDVYSTVQVPRSPLKPVRDLLDELAASIGGEVQAKDTMVVITPTDATFDAKLAEVTGLDDFEAGAESAREVLHRFLHGKEPPVAADDGPNLMIGPTREDKQFAMLATETLRRMRGLSGKIADPLLGHWAQSSEDDSIEWPRLKEGGAGEQRVTPISVAGLVRRTATLNGATVVVHWPDATRHNLSPTKILIPHAGENAAGMLGKIFDDHSLQVRHVDEHRWWIGTAATYDRAMVIVWTKKLGDRAESLQKRIAGVMAQRDAFRVTLDPESDRAMLLLPRYIVRQLPKIEASVAAN